MLSVGPAYTRILQRRDLPSAYRNFRATGHSAHWQIDSRRHHIYQDNRPLGPFLWPRPAFCSFMRVHCITGSQTGPPNRRWAAQQPHQVGAEREHVTYE